MNSDLIRFDESIFTLCAIKTVTLETIKCMPESDFDFLRECVKEVSRQSKWVADKEKDDRKLFPQACCVYRLGKNCFDKITETCTANPGRNPRQYWNQVLDSLMKNMDTLVCSRYDNEYCEQKGLFDQLSKIKYQGDPNEFLILPLLRVATRFTDDAQQWSPAKQFKKIH